MTHSSGLSEEPSTSDPVSVVDAHVHLWDPTVLTYDWLAGTPLDRRFDQTDLAAAGGVDRIVVVQADCRPEQSLEEVRWIAGLRQTGPTVVGIVAHAALEAGTSARSQLTELQAEPLVVGVRRLLQDEPPGFTDNLEFRTGLAELAATGLPFDVCVRARQLTEVGRLVADFPEVSFVLDHLGKPAVGEDPTRWRDEVSALAQSPNIVIKLSGLATEVVHGDVSADAVGPYLRHALRAFGPDRCLFGSDWPVMTLATTYRWWLDVVREAIADLSPDDQAAVLGANAERIYRLTPSAR